MHSACENGIVHLGYQKGLSAMCVSRSIEVIKLKISVKVKGDVPLKQKTISSSKLPKRRVLAYLYLSQNRPCL